MDPIYDLASIRKTLRDGITKGYWTEEHFDTPSLGRRMLEEDMKHHKVMELRSFQLPTHRNLLRDDYHPEQVQAAPDPRDFAESKPTLRRTEPQIFNPEPTDQGMGTGAIFGDRNNGTCNESDGEGCNREGQAELGTEGSAAPSVRGESLDW